MELNDIKGFKRTFLEADTTTYTELFRDLGTTVFTDLNSFISGPYARAVGNALLPAFPGVTPVFVNDGDPHDITRLRVMCSE